MRRSGASSIGAKVHYRIFDLLPIPNRVALRVREVVFFVALTVAYTGGWAPSVGFAAAPFI